MLAPSRPAAAAIVGRALRLSAALSPAGGVRRRSAAAPPLRAAATEAPPMSAPPADVAAAAAAAAGVNKLKVADLDAQKFKLHPSVSFWRNLNNTYDW